MQGNKHHSHTKTEQRNYLVLLLLLLLSPLLTQPVIAEQASSEPATLEEKLIRLESEVKALRKSTKKNKSTQKGLRKKLDTYKDKLNIQGFLTAGLSQSNRDEAYFGASNDLSSLIRAKAGLQFNFLISDKAEAVVQLEGSARNEDWNLETSWAYLQYRFSSRHQLNIGRIRLPAFSQSQALNVGYSFPWVQPPIDAYGSFPFSDADGFIFQSRYRIGKTSWSAMTRLVYGNNSEGDKELGLENKDIIGLILNASNNEWNFHLSHGKEEAILNVSSVGIIDQTDTAKFSDLSIGYDNGKLMMMSEYTNVDAEGTLVGDVHGYYITLGYHFDRWLPYVTFGHAETKDDDKRLTYSEADAIDAFIAGDSSLFVANSIANIVNKSENTTSLGVRYDPVSNIAIKLQVDYMTDFHGTNGYLSGPTDAFGRTGIHEHKSATVVNLVVDAVF